jgi:hypothetical protein
MVSGATVLMPSIAKPFNSLLAVQRAIVDKDVKNVQNEICLEIQNPAA